MIDDSEDKKRTFIVTIKFKVGGYLPYMVTKEHVESNIRSEVEEAVGEIALASEYYDMDEDIEWGVYLEGDVKVNSQEFSIDIGEKPFCEHCGEKHEDFGIEVHDDGTSWCMSCFLSGSNDDVFSEEELNIIYANEKTLKKEFYKKKLKELEND